MLLLPSAAWGQWDTKTFVFDGCTEYSLYATDPNVANMSYSWDYRNSNGYGASLVDEKVKISVGDGLGKSVLTPPRDYTIKKVTLNYSNLEVTGESKIYVRAVNRTDTTTHYTKDPYLMTSDGSLDIKLNDEGISSDNLSFLIFSNDDKAYSYYLNSITITKIADYNISIGGVPLTGSNVNPETGVVTDMTGVAFTPANAENKTPATLTLNGAEITGAINCESDITIDLKGTNTITSTDGPVIINSEDYSLTFKSTDGTGCLEMSPGQSSGCISNPEKISYSNNLIVVEPSGSETKTYIEKGYGVWVDNYQLSAHHTAEGIFSGSYTMTYDNTNHILNLGDFTNGSSSLKSNIPELIVNLSGNNNMLKSIYFEGTGDVTSGSLNIQSNEGSILTLCDEEEEYSVIHGFDDVTFGNDVMNYTFATGPTTYKKTSKELEYAINNSPVYNTVLTFTSAETFEIWIGGTQVTSVFKETGITYDASGKLTLEDALINGPIVSGLGYLTIHLTGTNNKIKQDEESEESLIASTNNGVLSFETDNETIGSLVFQNSDGEAFDGDPISGFTKVEYGAGLDYDKDAQKIGLTNYPIYIGTTNVNSQNKTNILGNGQVIYDSENHIITLNNADITGPIKWELPFDLTIALNGTRSTITFSDGYAIMGMSETRGHLTIAKAEGASSSKLTMIGTGSPINDGFDNTSDESYAGEGLYWITLSSTTVEITDNPEYVIIEGYPMTDDRTISGRTGTTGTITYNSTDKILTIDNFEKEYETTGSGSISTGVVGLTVKLIGESSINAASANELFKAIRETATIEFVGVENGRLDITVGSTTGSPFKDFADGTITYDNLVLSGGGYGYSIAPPTAPEIKGVMYEGSPAVEITKNYVDGDIYFTIDYAGETEDVSKAKYTNRFTMAAPGIVTAWVEVNNATTDEVIGKYFGYIDTPCTIAKGSTKEATIYPLITEEDGFGISYSSQDESIATFANGIISGVAEGTTQVRSSLTTTNSSLNYTILNQMTIGVDVPDSYIIITMNVTVQELIDNNTFTSGQNYGTFFNTTTETYKVPEGLVAYIITGVDGNSITIAETKILPPNAPVLLYRTNLENATNYTFTQATSSDGTFPEGNILEYAFGDIPADASSELYVLYNGKFVKVTTGTDIAAKHCYLNLGGVTAAGTRGFYYIEGGEGTTAIQKVVLEKSTDGEWYTLQGQRVAKPAKGLYILNGKKVVVK